MKQLSAALSLLALVLGLSLFSGTALTDLTEQCVTDLEQAHTQALREDWEAARQLTQQARERWEKYEFPLSALLRHTEADEIQVSFRCVDQYLGLEELDQYTAANVTLMTQLERTAELERPRWENVL